MTLHNDDDLEALAKAQWERFHVTPWDSLSDSAKLSRRAEAGLDLEVVLPAYTARKLREAAAKLRDEDGFWRQDVHNAVESAILQYPNMDAPQWLGASAALGVVEEVLFGARADAMTPQQETDQCICTPDFCHGAEHHGGPKVCHACFALDSEVGCLAQQETDQ